MEQFVAQHGPQLGAIPEHLWPALQRKLSAQTFDAGEHLMMDWGEEAGWQVFVADPAGLRAADPNAVFLVDHAWSYTRQTAREALLTVEGLLERVIGLLDMDDEDPQPEPEPQPEPQPEPPPRDDAPISQESIVIKASSIPDAGQGAFAGVGLAPATLLGTYAGERLSSAEAQARYPRGDAYYLLAVPGEDDVLVDAADPERSNWLRYLNHA